MPGCTAAAANAHSRGGMLPLPPHRPLPDGGAALNSPCTAPLARGCVCVCLRVRVCRRCALLQHLEVVKLLQSKDAKMDVECFGTGTTPVMQAAKFGDVATVKVPPHTRPAKLALLPPFPSTNIGLACQRHGA